LTEEEQQEEVTFDKVAERFKGIIGHNTSIVIATQKEVLEKIYELIKEAEIIIATGNGRSGLAIRMFAQRLNHIIRALRKIAIQELTEKVKESKLETSIIIDSLCEMLKKESGVYFIDDTTTPSISNKCLVIMATGSGETRDQLDIAEEANKLKATLVVITSKPDSTIAKKADLVLVIPGRNLEESSSLMPMGTKFEVTMLDVLEILLAYILETEGISSDTLEEEHRNLK